MSTIKNRGHIKYALGLCRKACKLLDHYRQMKTPADGKYPVTVQHIVDMRDCFFEVEQRLTTLVPKGEQLEKCVLHFKSGRTCLLDLPRSVSKGASTPDD